MEGGQFSAALIDEDEDEAKHPEKGEVEHKITKQTQDCKHFVAQVPKQEGWVSLHDEDRVKASSLDLADNFKLEQGKPCATSLVTTINTTAVENFKLEREKPCTIVRRAL